MVRAAAVLFCITVGLWIGYALWGIPAAGLGEALERIAVENDQLRTRLSEALRDRRDSTIDFSASLASIARRLDEQSESLHMQTEAITSLGNRDEERRTVAEQIEASLEECNAAQTKMQQQLERCLFAKADLERAAAAAKKAAEGRRPGKQTVTETIELPNIPGITDGVSPGSANVPIDARAVKSSSPPDRSNPSSDPSKEDSKEGKTATSP